MFFKDHLIVFSYPPKYENFAGPAGMPVSPNMAGEEFKKQCLELWELGSEEAYQLVIQREGQDKVIDVSKSLAENGVRNGDPIKIIEIA